MGPKFLQLFNGQRMPLIGLGTGNIQPGEMEAVILTAIETGYRHFDCALLYGNERIFGNAIKNCMDKDLVKREELFITSKLPMIGNHPDRVEMFLKKSLENLQLSYLDMYLIHFPVGFKYKENDPIDHFPKENDKILVENTDILAVWKAMETQVEMGRTKAIGVSNFNVEQINRILRVCKIQPANLQVEAHLYLQQRNLHKFCVDNKIVMSAFAPLGSQGRRAAFIGSSGLPNVLSDPIVKDIAEKRGQPPSNILLHFLVSRNIAIIPKSSNLSRIKANFQIFDISLTENEVKQLLSLDKGELGRSFRFAEFFKGIEAHPENPYALLNSQ